MVKLLGLAFLVLFSSKLSLADGVIGDYAFSFKCEWLPSLNHDSGYYVQGSGFTLNFLQGNEAYVTDDTFFYRSYAPCWRGGFESCAFNYSYSKEQPWTVDNLNDTFTQAWSVTNDTQYNDGLTEDKVTVSGVSILKFTYSEDGAVVISGDDGDGVSFQESFSCEPI